LGVFWRTTEIFPVSINAKNVVFSPAVTSDGMLDFIRADDDGGVFHIDRSQFRHGHYQISADTSFSTPHTAISNRWLHPISHASFSVRAVLQNLMLLIHSSFSERLTVGVIQLLFERPFYDFIHQTEQILASGSTATQTMLFTFCGDGVI
jgi:hypothetical protein